MIKPNASYNKMLEIWEKCRIAVDGDDAIKCSSILKKIVPELSNQDKAEYEAMVSRATYFNATGRTVDGLLGMAFRKPVIYEVPAQMQSFVDDITLAKDSPVNIDDFCASALREDIVTGRVGYLVEYPSVKTKGMSLAQVSAMNLRPYVAEYKAESILDWRFDRVNNSAQLVMVRLNECVEEWGTDGVTRDEKKQERRLLLENGVYIQRIYRDEKQYGGDIIPEMNGKSLSFIPFVCDFSTTKPPILDLANVNLSHFRTDVDREHGAHFTAVPTPMFSGFDFPENEPFHLGASGGYSSQNPDAKWGFLEFEGTGLGTLKEIKDEKQQQMVILGARFLDSEKAGVEAEGTVKIRRSGETSVLASLAQKRSRLVKRILEIMRDWAGFTGDISVEINTDYTEAGLSAQDLGALVTAWQNGAISQQTLYYNLKHGEMYDEETTFEIEQERINVQSITATPLAAI